jgi:hypothetical protein
MPSTVSDFQDDTAFEGLLLDRVSPLIPSSADGSVIDLRQPGGNSVNISLTESVGSGGHDQLRESEVRPLVFGAAWKVLDLLVELGLDMAGIPPTHGKRYTITEKVQKAGVGGVTAMTPFNSHAALWLRLMSTGLFDRCAPSLTSAPAANGRSSDRPYERSGGPG